MVDNTKHHYIVNFQRFFFLFLIFQEETPDDDETYSVVNSLKKVSIFYSCHNLGNWNIWASLFKDVEEAKDGVTSLPEEVQCTLRDTYLPLELNKYNYFYSISHSFLHNISLYFHRRRSSSRFRRVISLFCGIFIGSKS